MSFLHLRFNGESHDISLADLDVGDMSSDYDIKRAVANHMQVPASKLDNYAVEKNMETGDITLRPNAIFGSV